MRTHAFNVSEGTSLAHAMVHAIAASTGIRVLSIKGPASLRYGLRPPRVSADADLWVEPGKFRELCALLETRGWHRRVAREGPTMLPKHSRTLIHDSWPCDIDLHFSFSGVFGDPEQVFETLWEGRRSIEVANQCVSIPNRAHSAALGALHALRDATKPGGTSERTRVLEVVTNELSPAERADFWLLASRARASWILQEYIRAMGVGEVMTDISREEQRQWRLATQFGAGSLTIAWWDHLCRATWTEKPVILLRALWVPRSEVLRNDAHAIPGLGRTLAFQLQRWQRGSGMIIRYFFGRGE